ncbi:hypothetical protein QT231_23125 [Halomonas sp. SpR1]|nr:hypothetical protein [Halomonas sp. SpR1]MDQ7735600.1 hypothetical protein [Halomonas sp. SpR1]
MNYRLSLHPANGAANAALNQYAKREAKNLDYFRPAAAKAAFEG